MFHIADLEALVKNKDADAPKLAGEQSKTREDTAALASTSENPTKSEETAGELAPSIKSLGEAQKQMKASEEQLVGEKPNAAEPTMQAALTALRKAQEESRSEAEKLLAATRAPSVLQPWPKINRATGSRPIPLPRWSAV